MKRIVDLIRYYLIVKPACRKIYKECSFNIMTSEETIDYIIKNNCSITRFGDGEIKIMLSEKKLRFQDSNIELKKSLQEVILSTQSNLLVCLPLFFSPEKTNNQITCKAKRFWDFFAYDYMLNLYKLLLSNKINNKKFGDALISRPYIDWKHKKSHAIKIFHSLKKIWENKNLLIIEGEKTRLGVGNDLFAQAGKIRRILAPAENAFEVRSDIIKYVEKYYQGDLILIALGPTATVLAKDFAERDMQAIDIGHVDIEYSWYLKNSSKKIAIKGKYTNEAPDGRMNIPPCTDKKYLSEIILTIVPGIK